MSEKRPLITMTTDFGEADYFVPAMKGVIHSINPAAEIVDLTHLIPAHDLYAAAFTRRSRFGVHAYARSRSPASRGINNLSGDLGAGEQCTQRFSCSQSSSAASYRPLTRAVAGSRPRRLSRAL